MKVDESESNLLEDDSKEQENVVGIEKKEDEIELVKQTVEDELDKHQNEAIKKDVVVDVIVSFHKAYVKDLG